MKSFTVFMLLLIYSAKVPAQLAPSHFIGVLPAIPENACAMDGEARNQFKTETNDLINELSLEIHRRHAVSDAKVKMHQSDIEKKYSQQMGMTPEEMNKLRNNSKNMTKEQKQKLADSLMREQTNISLDELKKKRTKEGQLQWAQGIAKEKMAEASADPEKMRKEQETNMNNFRNADAQKKLLDSIKRLTDKFYQQFAKIEADVQKDSMLVQIRDAQDQMQKAIADGADENVISQYRSKIASQMKAFCNNYSPRYHDILQRYLLFIKESEPVYNRLEKMQDQLTQTQLGIKESLIEPGTFCLEAISGYLHQVNDVFRYRLSWEMYETK